MFWRFLFCTSTLFHSRRLMVLEDGMTKVWSLLILLAIFSFNVMQSQAECPSNTSTCSSSYYIATEYSVPQTYSIPDFYSCNWGVCYRTITKSRTVMLTRTVEMCSFFCCPGFVDNGNGCEEIPQIGSLRFAVNSSPYFFSGRLEVYINGTWGTVCADGWGINETNVACRQMGFARGTHRVWPINEPSTQPIWLDKVECLGGESQLTDCKHSNFEVHDCDHSKDIGIVCANLSLVEGGAANEGRIEVFHEGVWQSLCDSSWDLRDGDVVCRELGYGYAVRVVGNALFGEGNGPQWKIDLHCSDNATGLKYCENDSQTEKPCTHNEDAGAICSKTRLENGSLRLADSGSVHSSHLYAGRLEVYSDESWGTVCNVGWGMNEANVACRQMGFVRATHSHWPQRTDGDDTQAISWYDVKCTGNESLLIECRHVASNESLATCVHSQDVGTRCTRQTLEEIGSIHPSAIDPKIPLAIVFSVAGFSVTLCVACLVLLCMRKRCRILKGRRAQKVTMMQALEATVEVKMSNNEYSINLKEPTLHGAKGTVKDVDEWEMKYSDLQIRGHLGSGQFGDVSLAFLTNPTCTPRVKSYVDRMYAQGDSLSSSCAVAMKAIKDDIPSHEKQIFLNEIELMKKVSTAGSNHIVQLIGCIVSEAPMAMIMEYSPFGDLHSHLLMWREQGYVCPEDITNTVNHLYLKEGLTDEDLMSFAHQISIGMTFLASLNVIHRDLACRNILIGYGKVLKIADFGLSKEIDGLYTSASHTRLPIRWMAPEAITHRLFSEKSDVWSYGVCLWEMCTLGEVPYGYISNKEVAKAIASAEVLEKPERCTLEIYELMNKCWVRSSKERPTFKEIDNYLEKIIKDKLSNNSYIDITAVSATTGDDPLNTMEISPSVKAE